MIFINPQNQPPTSCINCQAVTTSDGKTVWVCERCGVENTPSAQIDTAAQEEITKAAADAGAQMPDITTTAAVPAPEPVVSPAAPVLNSIPEVVPPADIPVPPASQVADTLIPPANPTI